MPRKPKGTVLRLSGGLFQPQITLADKTRKRLPPFPAGTSYKEAKRQTAELAAEAMRLGLRRRKEREQNAPKTAADAWVAAWLTQRRQRGFTSVAENEQHWVYHLREHLGSAHPRDWTAAELRRVVAHLDQRVQAGKMAWKTARNVWGTCSRMCRDASRSKLETLRCREDNPARDVEPPDKGAVAEKQWLYPSEAMQLFEASNVELWFRRAIAIAIYSQLRDGELETLRWEDVQLDKATLHIHRAADRRRPGAVKAPKRGRARWVAIEPELLPLLRAMRGTRGLVLPELAEATHLSRTLRRALWRAGVRREALHQKTEASTPLTWHALRGTGITWRAVRGDNPHVIQEDAGHRDYRTTEGYIRRGRRLGSGFGKVFAAIPQSLLNKETPSISLH